MGMATRKEMVIVMAMGKEMVMEMVEGYGINNCIVGLDTMLVLT